MNRVRKFLTRAAILIIGAAILSAPTQARAGFSVQVYDDGVLSATTFVQVFNGGNNVLFFDTTKDFSISGTAGIQLSGNAQLTVSYTDHVTTLTSGTNTLTLLVTNTNYLLPSASLVQLTSSGGGQYTGATGDSIVGSTLGFLDSTDVPFGNGQSGLVTVANPSGAVAPNASSTPISTTGIVSGNTDVTQSLVYSPGTGISNVVSAVPFSLTNVSFFTFDGAADDNAGISNSLATSNATVTPAPDGLVLVLAGIPCLGVAIWLRRRRQGCLAAI